jgi:hypothetical protein
MPPRIEYERAPAKQILRRLGKLLLLLILAALFWWPILAAFKRGS